MEALTDTQAFVDAVEFAIADNHPGVSEEDRAAITDSITAVFAPQIANLNANLAADEEIFSSALEAVRNATDALDPNTGEGTDVLMAMGILQDVLTPPTLPPA